MNRPRLTSAVIRGLRTYQTFTVDLDTDLEDRPKQERDIKRVMSYLDELVTWYLHTHPDFKWGE
jgi:hypothetical protein